MQKPLISIVTVTYNLIKAGREETFRQCLESIHNQSYENIEHLVIDGASSDGTLEIIKEYAAKGWIKYISEPDTGIYDAMNKGYRMAKGDYIGILNSDDYYHDLDGIRKIAEELEKTKADYCYGAITFLDEEKDVKWVWQTKLKDILVGMSIMQPTMFIKKHIYSEMQGYDTNFKVAADYDFILRMVLSGKYTPTKIATPFITFRRGGISEGIDGSSQEVYNVFIKNYQPLLSNPIDLTYISTKKHLPLALQRTLFFNTNLSRTILFRQTVRWIKYLLKPQKNT